MRKIIGIAAVALTAAASQAWAQAYPSKPVHVMITFPPGSGTDIVGRVITQKLSEYWNQPVVVENRGGAGGVLGPWTTITLTKPRKVTVNGLTWAGIYQFQIRALGVLGYTDWMDTKTFVVA